MHWGGVGESWACKEFSPNFKLDHRSLANDYEKMLHFGEKFEKCNKQTRWL
jgi:hypothetical protein